MKKLLCFLLCLTLIFSSVSLAFAAQDVSDATTHTQLGNIYNLLNGNLFQGRFTQIYNRLTDINANIVTLMGWLDPSSSSSTAGILNSILNTLQYTDAGGAIKSWLADIWQLNAVHLPMLSDLSKSMTNYYLGQSWNANTARLNAHRYLIGGIDQGNYSVPRINGPGQIGSQTYSWREGSPIGNLAALLQKDIQLNADMWSYRWAADLQGYLDSQSYTTWDTLQSSTFTPSSSTNGLYRWLSYIQTPVARLSYVLASDERIAAQEAAADNEEAVVDNFIDSSGDGATSPSDIGSVSDLSSGYKQNFGTDASPSGIFDIFNSDHATWFSQETKNQLDTTTPSRMTKGSVSETPLLDKQIEDIYNALGVKQP